MLRTRLLMGAVLVALAVGVLVVDQSLPPAFPFLFVLVAGLSGVACWELLVLLPAARRPNTPLCFAAVLGTVAVNWVPHLGILPTGWDRDPWHWVLGVLTATVLGAFLVEMAAYREPGETVNRLALTVLLVAYLGLLPSFLVQLRWPPEVDGGWQNLPRCTVGLALAVFVPKLCDTGAYFTGRALGRHPMAPVLSPKKTWEGAVGGITTAVVGAVAIDRIHPALLGLAAEVGFGFTVGLAGMLGDLAESMVKRDLHRKDASQAMPGFGGVLDVVDAILFAAPVAYCWLK